MPINLPRDVALCSRRRLSLADKRTAFADKSALTPRPAIWWGLTYDRNRLQSSPSVIGDALIVGGREIARYCFADDSPRAVQRVYRMAAEATTGRGPPILRVPGLGLALSPKAWREYLATRWQCATAPIA
jgi:hypothetical protein